MKKGLILEGGAMRGMFTAGVMDVMMEHGIEFDGAVGVSAGAAFGCNYKSKQIGRVLRYNTRFCRDKRYGGFRRSCPSAGQRRTRTSCGWSTALADRPPGSGSGRSPLFCREKRPDIPINCRLAGSARGH